MTSALYSTYIIDGIPQELSPAQILDQCLAGAPKEAPQGEFEQIADETLDPSPSAGEYDSWKVQAYLDEVLHASGSHFSFPFSAQVTKLKIAHALTEMLWREGRFRLGNLAVTLHWRWCFQSIGSHAAFYASVAAAGEYIDSLGLRIASYELVEGEECGLDVSVSLDTEPADDFQDEHYRTEHPVMMDGTGYPSSFKADPDSWIVYIPMESCSYRLGGSLLSDVEGQSGSVAPDLVDPDYFIDVFEVVREMVEDCVPLSVHTVAEGGLVKAIGSMSMVTGAKINIMALMKSVGEQDMVRTLFSEVPGVILQIKDEDFDYIDAEFTLQDVAFFPLGHPTPGRAGVKVDASDKDSIQTILDSLIRSQSSEGED